MVLTCVQYSVLVPHMKEPTFLPRYSMPASCIARKDNSTSLRVATTSDFPSLLPIPNSMVSNLSMCLRKEPLADGIGLCERGVRPAAVGKRIDWGWVALCESRGNIQYAIQPRGWERFVRVVLI
jgi:hypothetical protein